MHKHYTYEWIDKPNLLYEKKNTKKQLFLHVNRLCFNCYLTQNNIVVAWIHVCFTSKWDMDVNQYARKNIIEHTIAFWKSFNISSLFSHIKTILLHHVLIWTTFRFQVQYDMVFIYHIFLSLTVWSILFALLCIDNCCLFTKKKPRNASIKPSADLVPRQGQVSHYFVLFSGNSKYTYYFLVFNIKHGV